MYCNEKEVMHIIIAVYLFFLLIPNATNDGPEAFLSL